MKTVTCSEVGGACDEEISGNTAEELLMKVRSHVKSKHPMLADDFEAMTREDFEQYF